MAQTVGGMSFVNHLLEVKIAGGAFADMGGAANKLEVSGFDRITGKAFTQVGNTPIITSILYTEVTGEAWKVMWDAYLAGTQAQIQWTPKGTGVGNFQFTSALGFLKNVTPPQGESASGDPIMCEATLVTGSYARATLA